MPVEAAQRPAGESAEPEAAKYAPELDDNGRPVLTFPCMVRIHGRFEGHDDQLGGVMFAGGVSERLASYNEIMHVTACTGPVEDVATGIMLCPQYDGCEFVVDAQTRHWSRLRPVDEAHAAVMRQLAPRAWTSCSRSRRPSPSIPKPRCAHSWIGS